MDESGAGRSIISVWQLWLHVGIELLRKKTMELCEGFGGQSPKKSFTAAWVVQGRHQAASWQGSSYLACPFEGSCLRPCPGAAS